ncbi:MAG TPA: protein kinase [Thermoanaerobaculia bacterium]|nr:protein kinase [Thermoanaerobaculia bacterium]
MKTIGKYEILGELGKGGFGTVYRGRDTVLKRQVAIKICSAEDDDIRARFQREAEIVASLQHPNITTIHDLGVHEGSPYLVQELLSGEDLSGPIERRDPLPLERRLSILSDVARGLEHAHANEIIHRDIKPGNIRLLDDGTVKVMDFGIAKLASFATKLTKTGMMVGTAAYLAPEQIDDATIDGRCDIFSYGVLSYELLAYQRPFDASTISALLFQILQRPHLPLLGRNPECPPVLAALVEQCLEKNRDRRPQTFSEIRERLAALDAGTGPIGRPGAIGAGASATMGPASDSAARPGGTGGSDSGSSVHIAATRAYESGSTPVQKSARWAAHPADVPPDIPTVPLGTLPEFARPPAAASAPAPRKSLRTAGIAAALVLALVATGWYVVSSRRAVSPATAEGPTGPTTPVTGPTSGSEQTAGGEDSAAGVGSPEGEAASGRDTTTTPAPVPAEPEPSRPTEAQPGRAERPSPPPAATTPPARPSTPTTTPATREPAQSAEPDEAEVARPQASAPEPATPPGEAPSTATATTRPPPAAPAPVDHEPAIRRALDKYRQAYEQLDARLLAEVWPSLGRDELGRIERSFQSFDSVQVAIEGCRIEVDADRASARCQVRRTQRPKAGRVQTVDQQTTFRLERRGNDWVIEGL